MKLKDMSIGVKMGGIATGILMLLIIVGWQGFLGIETQSNESDKLESILNLDSTLLNREIDHLQWAAGVSSFLIDKTATVLKVETNENNCKLGLWLNDNKNMSDANEMVPEMSGIIERMKGDHARLHTSAIKIKKILDEHNGDRESSAASLAEIYHKTSVPALSNVRDYLHEISGEIKEHVKSRRDQLHIIEDTTRRNVVILTLIALIAGAGVSFFISREMAGQIREGVYFADKLASGDFSTTLDISQRDEVGVLADALNRIVKSLQGMVNQIRYGSDDLSAASIALSVVAEQMSGGAEETANKLNKVASASEKMSATMSSIAAATDQAANNINMVASAAEEMTSTINEISINMLNTSTMASEASQKANQASQKVNELGKSVMTISKVTEVITEIAEQTNLLALNATIEAARAGEAGKGFAVVANEIKELARQTAQATLEIRNNIQMVQSATHDTVKDINEVSLIIKNVNAMSSTVASAVDEQSTTTKEIADNISQASDGIKEVTGNISQVATVTIEIATEIGDVNISAIQLKESSIQVRKNSNELKEFSSGLAKMICKYKV